MPAPEGFGLKISIRPLQTLWGRITRLDNINARIASGQKLTLSDLENIEAGEKTDLTEEAHKAILETTLDLATSGDNTPTQLLALQHLADFPARAELREQREQRQAEMHTHKIEMDRKISAGAPCKHSTQPGRSRPACRLA